MNKNVSFQTTKCNISADYDQINLTGFESTLKNTQFIEELSIRMIAEYYLSITFASVQVQNALRSLKYFYPVLNDEIISKVSTLTKEIINNLNTLYIKLHSLFKNEDSFGEMKNEIGGKDELTKFQAYKATYMEILGVNKLGNFVKFVYIKNNILIIGHSIRRQIGEITLNFQLENFVNQTKKEQYYD